MRARVGARAAAALLACALLVTAGARAAAAAAAPSGSGAEAPPATSPRRALFAPPEAPTSPAAPPPRRAGAPGARAVVIGHRGASGLLPEHTAAAYDLAVAGGADFIECDVQLTADLQMVCRHDQNLNETTDALDLFPGRAHTYTIDGEESSGVHLIDLTLAEVRTLRARQRFPFRDQTHNGRYPLVTFSEFLALTAAARRVVGVYPETKHPAWHNALPQVRAANTTIQAMLVAALHAAGYGGRLDSAAWRARPAYIQSFELSSLKDMAAMTQLPLVLLLGGW
ncbi:MAG: PLC-like phosphodiesterase [Monoraphidium minutum]|nr:MAG: PLC-like phosphodiesterase [Monoraphidium minutum]